MSHRILGITKCQYNVRSKLCLPRKNYYDFSFQAMLCLAVSFVCFVFLSSGVLKLSNLGATSKY